MVNFKVLNETMLNPQPLSGIIENRTSEKYDEVRFPPWKTPYRRSFSKEMAYTMETERKQGFEHCAVFQPN